ncbi:MAG: hypothetical protein AAF152_15600 [Cyanobacteria bacterium P01_A01_bin.114]
MDTSLFLGKVLLASAIISLAIKRLAPLAHIPATTAVSLVLVLMPTLLLGGFLAWKLKQL